MISWLFFMIFLILFMMMTLKNDFLMILISMEFLVMTILLMIFFMEIYLDHWLFMIYLIFSVCESVIGLSLMISMINIYGNQNISLLSLMW